MLYFYQSSNPCICTPTPDNPQCPDDCNCLKVCHIAVNGLSDDAVGPCAATGTLDIADTDAYAHDFCACGVNPVVWSIEAYDQPGFITASITNSGVLTWVTQGPETAGEYYCITVKACCGNLSAYAVITIGIKDLCNPCPPACSGQCEECNACDGTCTGGTVETSVKTSSTSANASIAGS